jgi:Domain of unknown function (DUF4169)
VAEPINFNKARKARAAAEAKARSAANRVAFGRTKAEKASGRLEAARTSRDLDGKKRD